MGKSNKKTIKLRILSCLGNYTLTNLHADSTISDCMLKYSKQQKVHASRLRYHNYSIYNCNTDFFLDCSQNINLL